jgi:carbamoyl-phosphate synthase small subunit
VSAVLALADGTVFNGISIGAKGNTTGEVVFNTAMTGYQEILSDPSYARQIVTLTCPHIGNTGTTPEDQESSLVAPAGLVIRDLPLQASNWRSSLSLGDYLERGRIVAIAGLDTRKLTRILREQGAQAGCIMTGDNIDPKAAVHAARRFPGLAGMDLAKVVSTKERYQWNDGTIWRTPGRPMLRPQQRLHVVAYDFGMKRNILRLLADAGCRMTVVPAQTPAAEVMALQPDGIFLSNGPGDPEPCTYAIEAIREFLKTGIPVFGICLGHQLLGLAAGARTIKMKFGHHGANQPVKDLLTGKIEITSQNHSFAADPDKLSADAEVTHLNLNDGTVEGLRHKHLPLFSVQYHPEACPGPHDASHLFERFRKMVETGKVPEPEVPATA